VGQEQARVLLPQLILAADPYEAADGADALVIVTEWDEYRALDLTRIAGAMNGNVMVDFRNVYKCADAVEAGLSYVGIGRRPTITLRQVWPRESCSDELKIA